MGVQLHVVASENYVTTSAKYDFTSNEYLQLISLSLSPFFFMCHIYVNIFKIFSFAYLYFLTFLSIFTDNYAWTKNMK